MAARPTMPPLPHLALLLALPLAAPGRPQGEGPAAEGGGEAAAEAAAAAREQAFDDGYARVQDAMEAQRWKEAYDRLRRLLDEHAGAPYAIDRMVPLEADLKRCAFWRAHGVPRIETLLDCKLVTWNRSTGGLRLRADPEHLGDFRVHGSDGAPEDRLYALPAQLSAEWTLTLRGSAAALEGAQVLLVLDERTYAFSVGCLAEGASTYSRHEAVLVADGAQTTLGSADPAVSRPGDGREVRVHVGERSLQLQVDGREVLDVDRDDAGGFGRMAFAAPGGFEELELAGRAESGWLDGVLDAAVQDARSAFERAWDPAEHLPAWLLAAAGEGSGGEAHSVGSFPMPALDLPFSEEGALAHLKRAQELWEAGRVPEAVAYARALGPEDADPVLRALLLAFSLLLADRPGEALAAGEALWSQEGSLAAGFLRALLLLKAKREDEAEVAFRLLAERHPQAFEPWYALASLLLSQGRAEEARAVLDQGQAEAAEPAQLRRLEGRIVLLFKGPAWRREHVQRAGHFVVRTDTDVETCRRVARECDAAWRDYERLFGAADLRPGAEMPVFLFAGQASYSAYVAGELQKDMQHTAGLFDPALQAILAWNAPSRATLHETLRHEVLHHYLDARLGDLPTWLNEGLAESCELTDPKSGRTALGLLNPEHAAWLAQGAPTDLAALVHQPAEEFYARPESAYPCAWAFVRFLRDTTPARRKVFDELWARLERREDNAAALDGAFAAVDWRVWNADFAAFARALPSAPR